MLDDFVFVVRCELSDAADSAGSLRMHLARAGTEAVDVIVAPMLVNNHVNHIYIRNGEIHLPVGRMEARSHARALISVHCEHAGDKKKRKKKEELKNNGVCFHRFLSFFFFWFGFPSPFPAPFFIVVFFVFFF